MKNKTNSFSFLKKPYFSAFKSNKTKKIISLLYADKSNALVSIDWDGLTIVATTNRQKK